MSSMGLTPAGVRLSYAPPRTGVALLAAPGFGTSGSSARPTATHAPKPNLGQPGLDAPIKLVPPPKHAGPVVRHGKINGGPVRVKNLSAAQHVRTPAIKPGHPGKAPHPNTHMSKLSMPQRRALSPKDYVFPERAPHSGSYPIPDHAHAHMALADSAGTKDHHAVRRAVCAKFGMGCGTPEPQTASPGV